MLPSSAPPTINRSLVRSFSVGNKVVIGPRRGILDVNSAGEEEHRRESDVLWRYPSPWTSQVRVGHELEIVKAYCIQSRWNQRLEPTMLKRAPLLELSEPLLCTRNGNVEKIRFLRISVRWSSQPISTMHLGYSSRLDPLPM